MHSTVCEYLCACMHAYLCACMYVIVYMCVSIYARVYVNGYSIICDVYVCELVCMCVHCMCVDPFEGINEILLSCVLNKRNIRVG